MENRETKEKFRSSVMEKICIENHQLETVSFYRIKAKLQCKTITALHDLKINDSCSCEQTAPRSSSNVSPRQFTFLLGSTPDTDWFNEAKLKITQLIKSGHFHESSAISILNCGGSFDGINQLAYEYETGSRGLINPSDPDS